jgi:hypothetical protein
MFMLSLLSLLLAHGKQSTENEFMSTDRSVRIGDSKHGFEGPFLCRYRRIDAKGPFHFRQNGGSVSFSKWHVMVHNINGDRAVDVEVRKM